jgi:hypothetical protein
MHAVPVCFNKEQGYQDVDGLGGLLSQLKSTITTSREKGNGKKSVHSN